MKLVKIIKYFLTIIIFISLQVTLCRNIAIFGIVPNVLLPFVISLAIVEGSVTGAVIGLVCGLFADAHSSGITIINSITYMYIAIIFGTIASNYLRKNLGTALMFTFLGVIVIEECIHFLHFAIWGVSGLFSAIINPILPTALYSTVLCIPIFYFTRKLFSNQNRRDYI